jgi:hypothetical protein
MIQTPLYSRCSTAASQRKSAADRPFRRYHVPVRIILGGLCLIVTHSVRAQDHHRDGNSPDSSATHASVVESTGGLHSVLDALKNIRITGYVQTQFRSTQSDTAGRAFGAGKFQGGTFSENVDNMFQIRRGRLKVEYKTDLTRVAIQLDALPSDVKLKEAYVELREPWTGTVGLQAGVFDRPFGYEVSYSSSRIESPERSRVVQTLFPGEGDLGAKLFVVPSSGPWKSFRLDVGVFTGTSPTADEYDSYKDFIGQISVRLPLGENKTELGLGISGYVGKVRNNTRFVYSSGNIAPGVHGFVVDSAAGNLGAGVTRSYVGADVQFSSRILPVGTTILRGELITGTQPGSITSSVSPTSQPTSALYKRSFMGWYATLVQNLGSANQLVIKADFYDPNTDAASADFVTGTNLGLGDIRYTTIGMGAVHHWDEHVKFVIYYDRVMNERLPSLAPSSLRGYTGDARDDVFTFRIQYRF